MGIKAELRPASDRGHVDRGWLQSFHSFSFADYYDPDHMGFGPLRVINEDIIAPGSGFDVHGHRDMEIITYLLAGELTHKDSMGNGSTLHTGDVQRMSAGMGVQHSEFNHSSKEHCHLLQIWIQPNVVGVPASYEEKNFSAEEKRGHLRLIASPEGTDGSILIHQDARVYAALLDSSENIAYPLHDGRLVYLHLVRGKATVNGQRLVAGDALKISGGDALSIAQGAQAELLLFDLPAVW
ncbi:MAG: pirin family protein [Burkholderiaceae bacterium]|nr:MAG: pirin family protein [Burkholderiaceae bacterium]